MTTPAGILFGAAGDAILGYQKAKQQQLKDALAAQQEERASRDQRLREVATSLNARRAGYVPQGVQQAQVRQASVPIGGQAGTPAIPDLPTLARQAEHGTDTLTMPGGEMLAYSAAADPELEAEKRAANAAAAQHGYRMEEIAAQNKGRVPEPVVAVEGPQGPTYVPRSQAVGKTPVAHPTVTVKEVQDPKDPTKTIYVRTENAVGMNAPAPSRAGGLMGGMAARAGAQAAGALNAMEHASGVMKGMEADIASGKIPLTGVDEFVNKIAGTEDPNRPGVHPIDKAAQTLALVGLAKVNPALARYLRLGIQFGVDESAFTNRTSDFRTKLMDFLSRVHAGFSPEMIQDVGDYRENLTRGYRSYFPADQTGGAPQAAAPTLPSSVDKAKYASDKAYKAWVDGKLGIKP